MTALFLKGKEGLIGATIDWDGDTIKAALLDTGTADTGIKAITGATNATPIVVTATSHGFTNGDYVLIDGVVGNLAANGLWKIANTATNTFELQRPDGTNASGSGTYSSGGYALNLGPSGAGDNWDDFDGALVGTATTIANRTVTNGVADGDDVTFSAVTGNSVEAIVIYKDTGTASTSKMIWVSIGKHIVTVAKAASSSATSIDVEPLAAAIPNSTVLTFSDGKTATLSAVANVGDRTLTVSSLASGIAVASRALAPATGSGLPVSPNGGSITCSFDNGQNRVFAI